MPLRLALPQQQTTPGMVGAPRASVPALVNNTGAALQSFVSDVEKIGNDLYKRQVEADLYDRLGKATAEVSNLELQFDHDPDFRTAPQRFQEQADAIRDKYLDGVTDTAVATLFKRQYGQIALAKSINVRKGAWKKEADYNVASLDDSIQTYATAAANAKNPAEATLVEEQARLSIARMQANGWISAEDAGKRERTFLTKRDTAIVLRDMSMDAGLTASKLSLDPSYAANVDVVQRERLTDQAYRRSVELQKQTDAAAERERKRRGDELLKDAIAKQANGTLTRQYVEDVRPFIEPSEYKSLLAGMSGADRKDDAGAYAELQGLLYSNPQEAERRAFVLHRQGLIKNETLAATLTKAREIGRQEGPRTPYERERQFITNAIKPSDLAPDPAGSARYALVIREFDDFAQTHPNAKPEEIRTAANDILKKWTLVDMVDLARATSAGVQTDPQKQIDANVAEAGRLMDQLQAKQITEPDFRKKMDKLNASTKAAEKALRHAGK